MMSYTRTAFEPKVSIAIVNRLIKGCWHVDSNRISCFNWKSCSSCRIRAPPRPWEIHYNFWI